MAMSESEFSEHRTPAGGWQFRQPETKWVAPTPISSTLNQTVMLIIAMRKKNAAITSKYKLATNYEAVKAEVLRFNRKRLGLSEESVAPPTLASRKYPGSAVGDVAAGSAISGLKRAAQGTAVVLEWLGAGAEPVSQELAERRAETCVACQYNETGAWYTESPAELIKKSVEAWKKITGKIDFEFKNKQGDKLKSCAICKCLLSLKIFCPMEHILKKTTAEVMAELPAHCWISRRE